MRNKEYKRRLKIRETALGFVVAMILALSIIVPQTASAVSLRHNTMLENNVITLGDIFAGLERNEDKVLGPAPLPGKDMVLNARTLLRVAIAMDLPWRPSSGADQIVLSRAATVVNPLMIKEALSSELAAKGVSGNFDVAVLNGVSQIILPYNEEPNVAVESISFDDNQNHFDAVLVAPSLDNQIVRERITGRIQRMISVPVLKSPIKHGHIIRANDLSFMDMRAELIKHDMVIAPQELIGKTPRRVVLAGEPVKTAYIEEPQVVERGDRITMVYQHGPLSLTAEGKALEGGANGDFIRVVNAASNRTIEAKVTGLRQVTVENLEP